MSNLPSKLGQIGPKWDKSGIFFRSDSVHFDSVEPKCTESDLEKSDSSHFGLIWPTDGQNLVTQQKLLYSVTRTAMPDSVIKSAKFATKGKNLRF